MANFSNDQLLEALQGKLPQEWRMDPHPHFFIENYIEYKDAIMNAMKEYEEACAKAKVRMYMKIGSILKLTI